ncbi:hypothetical protein, partial [Ralstonia pseudosolanacearum]|uniref:hypothetical protein n=1 Tax=Ralstonia pseudosolanacearum TaxID=1310165 RepID=UPI0020040078
VNHFPRLAVNPVQLKDLLRNVNANDGRFHFRSPWKGGDAPLLLRRRRPYHFCRGSWARICA